MNIKVLFSYSNRLNNFCYLFNTFEYDFYIFAVQNLMLMLYALWFSTIALSVVSFFLDKKRRDLQLQIDTFYEGMAYRFSQILGHVTNGNWSKVNYTVEAMIEVIDEEQKRKWLESVQADILSMINADCTLEEIEEYVESLI